jgi:heme/copper-type cytochrome/quinol oxidase subunit 2
MPASLTDAIFWVAVACCGVAQLLLLRSVLAARGAARPAESLPPLRRAVEVAWAVVPAVALALVLAMTWRAMHPAAAPADAARAAGDLSALSAPRGGFPT